MMPACSGGWRRRERGKTVRFERIVNNPEFPNDGETCWWWDTARPGEDGQPFIAVQTYCGKDPNAFTKVERLLLLFTDQAEYYAVCPACHSAFQGKQWSGSTRAGSYWRETAEKWLIMRQKIKPWCDFCDPIFGNGGWRV